MAKPKSVYFPIIYVRGYAMTKNEIQATTSTPYMGFNLGSTKVRQDWRGKMEKHIFESPLIRLMKDHGYQDIYHTSGIEDGKLSVKTIYIHRYYDEGDPDFGDGVPPKVDDAAQEIEGIILSLRKKICGTDKKAKSSFKVYLIAHSMGGLVCRCYLQNDAIGKASTKKLVDKVFTYATPHNGIDMAGINVPSFVSAFDINNFNRKEIAKYLGLESSERVDTLDGKFDPARFFCLVGTNYKDYDVAMGLSRKFAGKMSDGLVKIKNATVQGAPRAFVYRSHSGPYGIVNSESGYQNLVRFLFGDIKITGIFDAEILPLPPKVAKMKKKGKTLRASYLFETTVAPRGVFTFKLTERKKETFSAVLRKFDDLFSSSDFSLKKNRRSPVLFSSFLDSELITTGRTLVFSVDLSVSTTGYEFDGFLGIDHHIPGEYLYRDMLTIRALKKEGTWSLKYTRSDQEFADSRGSDIQKDERGLYIPLENKKGFKGKLRIDTELWNTI